MMYYEVTKQCPTCDGAGYYAITADPSSIEHECSVCEGIGIHTIKEVAELYERTSDLLEDYPEAIKIERIRVTCPRTYIKI